MPIESVIAVRIARAALPCLALVGLIGWVHAPKADTPSAPFRAVESLNFTGLAQFTFVEADRPGTQDTITANQRLIGGWVTAPLGNNFGVRLALDGGIEAVSGRSIGEKFSASLLNAGGDIFVRDPSRGYVQLGYRWNGSWWGERNESLIADFMVSNHQLRYSVGFFNGDFDLELGVEYLRLTSEVTLTTLPSGDEESIPSSQNAFRLLGGSTWYVADTLALGFDVEWGRTETPEFFSDSHLDRFQARFGADWQPPVASLRAGTTVGLSAGLGYYTTPVLTAGPGIPSTLENLYEFEYDIRLGVTLYFPGASSLKERARRYQ